MLSTLVALTDPLTAVLIFAFGVHFRHRFDRLDRRVSRLEEGLFRCDGGPRELPPAPPTEAETPRDGLLSRPSEWHALALGAGAGLTAAVAGRPELLVVVATVALGVRAAPTKRLRELRREPWYGLGGAAVCYIGADVVEAIAAALHF